VAAGGNPDAIKIAIEPELNAAVTRAVEEQMKHLGGVLIAGVEQGNKTLENQAKRAATEFRRTEKAAENLGRAVHGMDDGINGAMGAINKQVEGLLNLFGRLNRAVDENVAATRSATEVARRGSIERTNVVSDAARKEIENTRRASSAYIVEQQRETSTARSAALERIQQSRNEGRLSVVAAQAAAKRRILITQALTQTIGRLEKGLGAAIAATARTAVSAFSKAFDALKTRGGGFAGAVREQNADLARELRRTNSVVETNTKEINNSFVEGTSRSLNQREDIIRRSFIEQEQIIRRSTVRQEAAFAKLRKVSSTGVAGAVTGRGIGLGIGGLVGGLGVAALLKEGFKQSVDLNEQLNKTRVVFGQSAQAVIDFSNDAVNSLGATRAEALGAAATFGNLFRAIGIAEAPSAKMSDTLVQLAADLSSFNNVDIDQAFDALRAGLTGETEPLKKFGVNLNEQTLKAKALELGLGDGKAVLSAYAKAQAAFALIMEQTTLAQGDFARTADQGANAQRRAQKAMLEFAAAIAGTLRPALTAFFNIAVKGFTALTKVILGTSPALKLLKDALFGAAAGLAAIIAAKGAVQVIQLLGQAVKLSLTPMGLLLVSAAVLGAGLSVLLRRSAPLRAAFEALGDRLEDLGARLVSIVVPALRAVGRFIDNTVIPAVQKLVIFLAEHVVTAFDATSKFIVNVAVPAIVRASQFIGQKAVQGWKILVTFFENRVLPVYRAVLEFINEKVIPRLSALAKVIKDEVVEAFKLLTSTVTGTVIPAILGLGLAFGPVGFAVAAATSAIIFFWDSIRPILEPAIEGFETLGSALAKAFTLGDFSDIGSGLAAAATGIGRVARTIGGLIVDVLAAAGRTVVSFLKDVFSLPHLIAAGKGFLDFVEFVGRTIGRIVTDPRFLTAVAALGAGLVAAAGLIAFRFLKGFADAFLDNLGANVSLIGGALLTALVAAFNFALHNVALVTTIGLGLFALFRSRQIFQGFQKAGGEGAKGFVKGFATSLRSAGTNSRDFVGGLFGSQALPTATGQFKNLQREILGVQTKLRILGSTTWVNARNLSSAREELDLFGQRVSDARLKGLILRDTFKNVGSGIATIFRGLGTSVRSALAGVRQGVVDSLAATNVYAGGGGKAGSAFVEGFRSKFKGAAGSLSTGFATVLAGLQRGFAASGATIGQVFGKALAGGAIAAVAAIGGFTAGKAEGSAGGSGLLAAIIGGVGVGAAIGGPFGAAVGAITGGAALIGASFGRAEKKAKEFREEVDKLAGILSDDLVDGLKDGTVALDDFGNINLDVSGLLTLGDNFQQTIDQFGSKLSKGTIENLNKALGPGSLSRVLQIFKSVNGDFDKFTDVFNKTLIKNATNTQEFLNIVGGDNGLAEKVRDALAKIAAPGGPATAGDLQRPDIIKQLGLDTDVSALIVRNQKFFDSILKTAGAVGGEAKALAEAAKEALLLGDATRDVVSASQSFERKDSPFTKIEQSAKDASQATADHARDIALHILSIGGTADDVNERLSKIGLPPLDDEQIKNITDGLGDTASAAEAINAQLELMPDNFAAAFNAANGIVPTIDISAAITQTDGLASALQRAVGDKNNPLTPVIGQAEFVEATGDIGELVGKVLAQGIQNKTIVDEATAAAYVKPIQDALLEALGPRPDQAVDPTAAANWQATSDAIKLIFINGLSGITPEIDAAAMAQKAQEDLANMPPLIINGKLQFGDLTNPLATIRPGFNNQQASSAPLIGTLNINGATNPTQTANQVANAVRSTANVLKGVS